MSIKPTEQLSVVIPMYNEEDNVDRLVKEVNQALADHPDFEIIIVDDGSKDNTLTKLNYLLPQYSHLKVLSHQRNFGQSVAIASGVSFASKPWIASLDGDGQNDPQDIFKLTSIANSNINTSMPLLIVGHRINRQDSAWKKFGSVFANIVRRKLLKDDLILFE